MNHVVLGTDIGGTHMRLAVVDEQGAALHHLRRKTLIAEGAKVTSGRLMQGCQELMDWSRDRGCQVQAIGLGVAGRIDASQGKVLFSPHLPEMNGYPLGLELRERFKLPVVLENDANVFGIGEQWAGAGRDVRNWVGLTLGTGVGGCLILEGRLWQGSGLGSAGELGHMVIDPRGPRCACGVRGCLEAHASQSALLQGVHQAIAARALTEGPLLDHYRAGALDAATIYACAQAGDSLALELFQRMGWALGLALASLFSALGICHAIIGGGVSAGWDAFIEPLHASLAEHISMVPVDMVSIQRAQLGDDAALLGAARLAWQNLDEQAAGR
jgi:glucokinase